MRVYLNTIFWCDKISFILELVPNVILHFFPLWHSLHNTCNLSALQNILSMIPSHDPLPTGSMWSTSGFFVGVLHFSHCHPKPLASLHRLRASLRSLEYIHHILRMAERIRDRSLGVIYRSIVMPCFPLHHETAGHHTPLAF